MAILSPFPVSGNDIIVFGGNSITAPTRAWQLELIRRLTVTYVPVTQSKARVFGGQRPVSRSPVYVNTGIGGQVIQDLITNFDAQFTIYNPTKAFVEIGVNDVPVTLLATYTAAEATLAGLFASRLPSCKVFMISILTRGEVWTSGTPNTWGPNAGSPDSVIDNFNAAKQAQAVTSGFGYGDVRAYWLTLEPTGNPSKAASGYLTVAADGVHPSDGTSGPFGAGKVAICDSVQAGLSISA